MKSALFAAILFAVHLSASAAAPVAAAKARPKACALEASYNKLNEACVSGDNIYFRSAGITYGALSQTIAEHCDLRHTVVNLPTEGGAPPFIICVKR